MQTHTRRKLEMFIEEPLLERVIALLESCGARGWSVLPARSGSGPHNRWEGGLPGSAGHMVMLVVVTDEQRCERLLERLQPFVDEHAGVVWTSEVEVLRADHF